MANKSRRRSAQRQQAVTREVRKLVQKADSMHFFNLLTGPELLESVEALLPEYRERKYPPTVTLAMFLGQVLSADGSCQNAVDEAIVNRLLNGVTDVGSANTGGYCHARQRLPIEMVRQLARQTGALLTNHTPHAWLWRGRHVKLTDGTTCLLPDTPPNQAKFPQHGQQELGAGFPLARIVGVTSLANGAVLDVAMGPYKGKGTGEHGLFRELRGCFVEGDVMLADSYYCSFYLIADLLSRGVDVLFEQHGARITDFRAGEKLGTRDHVVKWSKPARPTWMTVDEYQRYPSELTLREAKVGKKVLVTSFLNPREVCKRELGRLFLHRWNVELDIRHIKTTLGMDKLSCKDPEMCAKEAWVYMLAYNLIRLLMAQAAVYAGVLPRQLSFKHTLQVWIAWSHRQFLTDAAEDTAALFRLIAQVQVGNRPGRVEPRLIKQRPKPFARLQTTRRRARANIRKYGRPKRLRA